MGLTPRSPKTFIERDRFAAVRASRSDPRPSRLRPRVRPAAAESRPDAAFLPAVAHIIRLWAFAMIQIVPPTIRMTIIVENRIS